MNEKKAEWLMVSVTFAWGMSYLLMKIGLEKISPFNLIALRFGIGFLGMCLLFKHQMQRISPPILKQGIFTGSILFLVFTGMVCGVQKTTASTAGFLTSAAVILVPILESMIYRKIPTKKLFFSIFLSVSGLYFLTVNESLSLDSGSFYCLMGAFFYAVYILVMDKISKKGDTLLISIIQLGTASFLGLLFCILREQPCLPGNVVQWGAVVCLGLVCSAYGFVVQPIAQKYTSPEKIGLIFSLEPVFSAAVSFLILKEVLSFKEYVGMFLILCGIICSKTLGASSNNACFN